MERAELLEGVEDPSRIVAAYFDDFDWEGEALDAETVNAGDFLSALGD